MVFILQSLYGSLFIRPGQQIEPMPREIAAESAQVCSAEGESKLLAWLRTNAKHADKNSNSTPMPEVHLAIDEAEFGFKKGERAAAILEAGLVKKSDGRGFHFYMWKFPEPHGLKGLIVQVPEPKGAKK